MRQQRRGRRGSLSISRYLKNRCKRLLMRTVSAIVCDDCWVSWIDDFDYSFLPAVSSRIDILTIALFAGNGCLNNILKRKILSRPVQPHFSFCGTGLCIDEALEAAPNCNTHIPKRAAGSKTKASLAYCCGCGTSSTSRSTLIVIPAFQNFKNHGRQKS